MNTLTATTHTVTVTLGEGSAPFDLELLPGELATVFENDSWRVLAIDGSPYSDSRNARTYRHTNGLVTFSVA